MLDPGDRGGKCKGRLECGRGRVECVRSGRALFSPGTVREGVVLCVCVCVCVCVCLPGRISRGKPRLDPDFEILLLKSF